MSKRARAGTTAAVTVLCTVAVAAVAGPAGAGQGLPGGRFLPGSLLVSESFYTNDPGLTGHAGKGWPGLGAGSAWVQAVAVARQLLAPGTMAG